MALRHGLTGQGTSFCPPHTSAPQGSGLRVGLGEHPQLLLGAGGRVRASKGSSRKAEELEKGAVSQGMWVAHSERQGDNSLKPPEGIRQEYTRVVLTHAFMVVC